MGNGLAQHFMGYLVNNCVGGIASAWLRHGYKKGGDLRSDTCVKLSHMHSAALDFPKSARPVDFKYDAYALPYGKRPDFQGGDYKSPSALGELYRAGGLRRLQTELQYLRESRPTPSVAVNLRLAQQLHRLSCQSDWEEQLKAARRLRNEYNRHVKEVMYRFKLTKETQFVLRELPLRAARRLGNRGYRERERLETHCRAVEQKYRDVLQSAENKVDIACTWYYTCYADEPYLRQSGSKPMLSFAWLAAEWLCAVVAAT